MAARQVRRLIRHGVDCEAAEQLYVHQQVAWTAAQLAAKHGFGSVLEILWRYGRAVTTLKCTVSSDIVVCDFVFERATRRT